MRKTINISVPEDMYTYILKESRYGSVSEYIRSILHREMERRSDDAKRPLDNSPVRANSVGLRADAFDQLEKLREVLERIGRPHS